MISFNTDLANILFCTAPQPERAAAEAEILARTLDILNSAPAMKLFSNAAYLDAEVIGRLSGQNILPIARLIEARSPQAIENMPRLRRMRDHLARSAELGQVLSPESLRKMIAALEAAVVDEEAAV